MPRRVRARAELERASGQINQMPRRLRARAERFAVRGSFTISRGSRTHVEVVTVQIEAGGACGWGEGVPYARYGETVAGVLAQIAGAHAAIEAGLDRVELQRALPAGAARNALDCALWDLDAKLTGIPVWQLAGLPPPQPELTAFTLSLADPASMAAAAETAADRPLLKLKLGGDGDVERVRAVRAVVPEARLIVDANEAWTADQLEPFMAAMLEAGVEFVEQPLPAGRDELLARIHRPIPVGADESVHDAATLAGLAGRYDVVNLKLDKTGGLTEALRFIEEAQRLGLGLMVGCMLGTSLAMAPAVLLAGRASLVDLDGPLLLAQDRTPALGYTGSLVHPPRPALWG